MPQLVKGGKYVFGISRINENFRIVIPPSAIEEYMLNDEKAVILISGSKTSGGFSICSTGKLKGSKLSNLLKLLQFDDPTGNFGTAENEMIDFNKRIICWLKLYSDGSFQLNQQLITGLSLGNSGKLVVVRGSGLGPGFIAKGPIFNEAAKHPELQVF